MSNENPLRVGDVLYGYCAGHFGRDSYAEKRVEAIGSDWVIARDHTGQVWFAECDPELLQPFRTPEPSPDDWP